MIQKTHPGQTIEVWFQDETRVGQQGRLTRVWGRKGERIRINKDARFGYTYIYGAICPDRDIGGAIVIDSVSKEATQAHLILIQLLKSIL